MFLLSPSQELIHFLDVLVIPTRPVPRLSDLNGSDNSIDILTLITIP